MSWTSGVQFLAEAVKEFFSLHFSSGAHPASYPVGTGGNMIRGEADHLCLYNAEV